MNKIINIKIQSGDHTGFQNIHINEINNIPDYSVDVLRFAELNALSYNLCETVLVQLLNKIRPQTGQCIIEIVDMLTLSNGYVNKMIDSATMSQTIEQNTTIVITLKRNSI